MSYTIRVKGFEPFESKEGDKLAYVIEQAGIDISHRCGGNARCTTCRVKFLSEEPAMHDVERACLEEDGVLGQFRLSCQIRVDRDMEVEVLMRASEQGWEPGVDLEP
jgi:ferredoxin